MNNERFPADLPITIEDFKNCGWQEILANASGEGYLHMWQAFSSGARKAMEEKRKAHGKVLRLLADVCSMAMRPQSANAPFGPMTVGNGWRSAIPDDLSEDDILFFSKIIDHIDDYRLKGRLADLIWLKNRKLGAGFALQAIDAYRSISIDEDNWNHDGNECWARAVCLVRMIKRNAGNRLEEMKSALVASFTAATSKDWHLILLISNLLWENRLASEHSGSIGKKLESIAVYLTQKGGWFQAQRYYQAASDWFKKSDDTAKAAEMTVQFAETWVKQAEAGAEQTGHLAARLYYEKAIQIYRTIPHSERTALHVNERIAELHTRLNEAGSKSLAELQTFYTPSIDITQLVEQARKAVSGKTSWDALKSFISLYPGPDIKQLRESALDRLRTYPLIGLFPRNIISRDGRIVATRPSMTLNGNSSDDETVIHSEMANAYRMSVDLAVRGEIWPALDIMRMEHRLRESDFIGLALQSPIVPRGRERLFGKAFFAGYDCDFVTAIHVLVPQMEHLVRCHLKAAGAKTTNLDGEGIENENGLSSLTKLPESKQLFGDNYYFEFNMLFCDAFGLNLRNELAHGLLSEEDCNTTYAMYAWWFSLKLVCIPIFFDELIQKSSGKSEEDSEVQSKENS